MPKICWRIAAMNPKFARGVALLGAAAALYLNALTVAHAAVIVNGDFSDPVGLAGWMATGTVVGEPTGDFAQLEADGGFQRTLEQTVTLPSAPSILSFDFAFSSDTTAPPSGLFPNAFTAFLDGVGGALDILSVDLSGAIPDPSDGNELILGLLPIDVDLDPAVIIPGFLPIAGGVSYSGQISLLLPAAVLGQGAILYFDLYDYGYGAASIAAVDNVSVDPVGAVPLPPTLVLMAIGLVGGVAARGRH